MWMWSNASNVIIVNVNNMNNIHVNSFLFIQYFGELIV